MTYYGQPLYLYRRDTELGQTNGADRKQFGGIGDAITVSGGSAVVQCYGPC